MIRLVAVDLDGTLLHSDGTVTPRTREVLDRLEERGVLVVFVTGRPVRWMDDLWHHVGDHGLAICSNGGLVYDVPSRSVVEARPITRDVGLQVAATIRASIPGSVFALERTDGFAKEPTFPAAPGERDRDDLRIGPLPEVFADDVVKMLALHLEASPADYWAEVEALVGRHVTTTWSSTGALVEMSAAGVTKASTLELLCAEREISAAEVLAFGDMPNDIAMLRWAGTSYAMGNAHPSVVRAAQHRAPSNDDDGVAQVLEDLLLG